MRWGTLSYQNFFSFLKSLRKIVQNINHPAKSSHFLLKVGTPTLHVSSSLLSSPKQLKLITKRVLTSLNMAIDFDLMIQIFLVHVQQSTTKHWKRYVYLTRVSLKDGIILYSACWKMLTLHWLQFKKSYYFRFHLWKAYRKIVICTRGTIDFDPPIWAGTI